MNKRILCRLHWAAFNGHFAVCQLIIGSDSLKNKNPSNKLGTTPLQLASLNGHLMGKCF